MMSHNHKSRAHTVHVSWSSSLNHQVLIFSVGHRSQGGIIHITPTHGPCTVCAWHLEAISFANFTLEAMYIHSHRYTSQLIAYFCPVPVHHCISCITSLLHSSASSFAKHALKLAW